MTETLKKHLPTLARIAAYTAYGIFILVALTVFYAGLVWDVCKAVYEVAYASILTVARLTEAYQQPEFQWRKVIQEAPTTVAHIPTENAVKFVSLWLSSLDLAHPAWEVFQENTANRDLTDAEVAIFRKYSATPMTDLCDND